MKSNHRGSRVKLKSVISSNFWALVWMAFAAFCLGAFFIISAEMREAGAGKPEFIGVLDHSAMLFADSLRNPQLTKVAIEVTALGSGTVAVVFIFLVGMLLNLKGRRLQAAHIVFAGIGAGILSRLMKFHFERPRPNILERLVEVQGFSYPSGHSLTSAAVYFTFAILLCYYFPRRLDRLLIIGTALMLIFAIALSRIYLGVHFISDAIAGVLLGIGWASTLAACSLFFDSIRSARTKR